MIERAARIVRTEGDRARIEILDEQGDCGSCQGGCGGRAMDSREKRRDATLEVANPQGFPAGTRVKLVFPPMALLMSAIIGYGLPLAGLLAGAFAGRGLAERFGVPPEPLSVVAGLAGLAALWLLAHRIARDATRFQPRISTHGDVIPAQAGILEVPTENHRP